MKPVLSSFFVLFDMTELGVEPEDEYKYVLHYRAYLRLYAKQRIRTKLNARCSVIELSYHSDSCAAVQRDDKGYFRALAR